MRTVQFVGLSDKAKKYIEDEGKNDLIEVFKNGILDRSYSMPVREHGNISFGMFEEEIQLFNYTLNDGSIIMESEQTSPWALGPIIFTYLENEAGIHVGKWTEEEMKVYYKRRRKELTGRSS